MPDERRRWSRICVSAAFSPPASTIRWCRGARRRSAFRSAPTICRPTLTKRLLRYGALAGSIPLHGWLEVHCAWAAATRSLHWSRDRCVVGLLVEQRIELAGVGDLQLEDPAFAGRCGIDQCQFLANLPITSNPPPPYHRTPSASRLPRFH